MTTTTRRIPRNDPRALYDLESADQETKDYHNYKALQEAEKIASKYRESPTYLRLLARHLENLSKELYEHQEKAKAKDRPNAALAARAAKPQADFSDTYSNDGSFRGSIFDA